MDVGRGIVSQDLNGAQVPYEEDRMKAIGGGKSTSCNSWVWAGVGALGTALLVGCGSGGGSTGLTGSTVNGTAEAPSSQVAELEQGDTLWAMLSRDILGRPAQADAVIPESPLAQAHVVLRTRGGHHVVAGPVTTGSDGSFQIQVPAGVSNLEVDVVSADGTVEVRAPVPAGGTVTLHVNEVSTVAADAAEQAEAQGATEQEADEVAANAQQAQDMDEHSNAMHIPDLHPGHVGPRDPNSLAQMQITANLATKLGATLGHSGQSHTARQAVQAALTYARVTYGASNPVYNHGWESALVNGPGSYTDAQIATALNAGGLTGVTAAQVDAALTSLNSAIGSSFTTDKIPAAAFILIALKPGPLQLTTTTALDAGVSSLTGTTVTNSPAGGMDGMEGSSTHA